MDVRKQRFFIDTNFILDIIEGRKKVSKLLLEKIKELSLPLCTSSFAICELIDKEQEFIYAMNLLTKEKRSIDEIVRVRKQKKISQKEREEAISEVQNFLKNNPVDVFTIRENGWNIALDMLKNLKVDACDSVHIATALEKECSVFITSDKQLGNEIANAKLMTWLSPEEALKVFKLEN